MTELNYSGGQRPDMQGWNQRVIFGKYPEQGAAASALPESAAMPRTLDTRVYDYLKHSPIKTHETCDGAFAKKNSREIFQEVMGFHQQVMEKNETMRLARQVGRMDDL